MKKENDICSFRLPSDALNYDRELLDRAEQSVETKSLLPILKDELRCKIQTKRLSQGLEELKVDFDIKPPQPVSKADTIYKSKNLMTLDDKNKSE